MSIKKDWEIQVWIAFPWSQMSFNPWKTLRPKNDWWMTSLFTIETKNAPVGPTIRVVLVTTLVMWGVSFYLWRVLLKIQIESFNQHTGPLPVGLTSYSSWWATQLLKIPLQARNVQIAWRYYSRQEKQPTWYYSHSKSQSSLHTESGRIWKNLESVWITIQFNPVWKEGPMITDWFKASLCITLFVAILQPNMNGRVCTRSIYFSEMKSYGMSTTSQIKVM